MKKAHLIMFILMINITVFSQNDFRNDSILINDINSRLELSGSLLYKGSLYKNIGWGINLPLGVIGGLIVMDNTNRNEYNIGIGSILIGTTFNIIMHIVGTEKIKKSGLVLNGNSIIYTLPRK